MTREQRLTLVTGQRRRRVLKCACGRFSHGPLPCLYCRVVADVAPPAPYNHYKGLGLALALMGATFALLLGGVALVAGVVHAFGG